MEAQEFRALSHNGIWKQNAALAQLLGLCPTLAISTSMVNSVSLSLATILVMGMASAVVAALRSFIPFEIRIPVFILIISSLVTVVDLAFNAWLHSLYLVLGIFIPLIVVNCIVLARVEAFAAKNPPLESMLDGAMMGVGLLWVLALLGGLRELVGTGSLLGGIDMVIPGAQALQVFPEDYPGFLLAILPPGAFFFLALLIAARNWMDARAARRQAQRLRAAAVPTAA